MSINGVAGYVDATSAANRFTWLRWNSELLRKEIHTSAQMLARDITRYCTVNDDAERLLETAINKLGLSAAPTVESSKPAAPSPISLAL